MSVLGFLASIFISQVFAIDVSYPIPELGNCGGVDECATYCDLPANYSACSQWAVNSGVVGDLPAGRQGEQEVLDDLGITFPIAELGNCTDTVDCMNYCDQSANASACLAWAEKHGVAGDEEVAAKMEGIAFPIVELGNCGSPSECATFCNQPANMQTCEAFSVAQGWGGGPPPGTGGMEGPGGCSSREECDAYCERLENREECTRWAKKYGMPHGGPGGCTTEEECRAYCDAHPDDPECQGGGPEGEGDYEGPDVPDGPGGCQTKEECESYCREHPEDPDCEWPEDEGPGGEGYEYDEDYYSEEGPPEGEEGPPEGEEFYGPGGCSSQEECDAYCKSHPDDPGCQGPPQ